ncbi:MAG: hypothetical protein ACD_72C00130G0001 [uncultured bacterium]|nr:MAG: hypothetical protein ACD_72C00130G0001 [uncultured bacterium]
MVLLLKDLKSLTSEYLFGLKSGKLHIARIAPVFGFIITKEALLAWYSSMPFCSRSQALFSRERSIVKSKSAPSLAFT